MGFVRAIRMFCPTALMFSSLAVCQAPSAPSDPFLKAYVGKDLSFIDEAGLKLYHRFEKAHLPKAVLTKTYDFMEPIDQLLDEISGGNGELLPEGSQSGAACLVAIERDRYAIYLAAPIWMTPSDSPTLVWIFDGSGRYLASSEFSLGWRMHPAKLHIESIDGLRAPVIEQRIEPGITAAPPETIYIGFDGPSPVLLATFDKDGNLKPNNYAPNNWSVGPLPRWTDEAGFKSAIRSDDEVKELEALTWVSGIHGYGSNYDPFDKLSAPGKTHDANVDEPLRLWHAVNVALHDPDIPPILAQLAKSKQPLLQEEARFAERRYAEMRRESQ